MRTRYPFPQQAADFDASDSVRKIRRRRAAKLTQTAPTNNPREQPSPSPIQPVSPAQQQQPQSAKETRPFLDILLSDVFAVSLSENGMHNGTTYLAGLHKELQEESPSATGTAFLTSDHIERVLVARLSLAGSAPSDESLLAYLLACYNRCLHYQRQGARPDDQMQALVTARNMITSYTGILLLMPDTFAQPEAAIEKGAGILADFLAHEDGTPTFVSNFLLQDIAERFENEGLDQITQLSNFCPLNMAPRLFEIASALGPFFRFSVFPEDDARILPSFFANVTIESGGRDASVGVQSLRMSVQTLRMYLYEAVFALIRASSSSREAVLTWIAESLRKNVKRSRMQVDRNEVSSDGFVVNVSLVLLQLNLNELFNSLTLATAQQIHLIDPDYFRHSGRIDISELTKINADQEASKAYYADPSFTRKAPNFISECFYLTLAFLHNGYLQHMTGYSDFMRQISQMQKHYTQLKAEQHNNPVDEQTPHQAMAEQMLQRLKKQLDSAVGRKLCLDALLFDEHMVAQISRFYVLTAEFITRVFGGNPTQPIVPSSQLYPMAQEPERFKFWPEYFLEDASEFLLFQLRYQPEGMRFQLSFDEYIKLAMTVLMNPTTVKNPYLKSKLVEVMFLMTFDSPAQGDGLGSQTLRDSVWSQYFLMPAVMQFYVDVELTGMSSQFYDKFNIRYNISQIIKAVWTSPVHKRKIEEQSKTDLFVRFVNMLMNDTRYLLDEGLTKLTEIHSLQSEMANTSHWDSLEEQVRKEKEETLEMSERQATSYMSLANETVHLLAYMTADIVDPFLTPEIIDRLAAMLDYNLSQLVGPKCTELKVQSPEKYRFQPKQLLSEILDIYLHLCRKPEFVVAVARDGRSYNKEWFRKAAGYMVKANMKNAAQIDTLARFVDDVENAIQSDMQAEEELGEIPDEFLGTYNGFGQPQGAVRLTKLALPDPLMFTLMEDPVLLPTSNITVDRSTIKAHLLGENRDPFNRMPLSMSMVLPNTELKEKIAAFKAHARKK
ncbi:Ubiquitin conjugation factor E4 [Sorochytrium milnesiophthora]